MDYPILIIFSKQMFNKLTLFLSISMLGMSYIVSAAKPITVKIAVKQNLADKYQNFLAKKQKQAFELTYMDMKDIHRGIIRLVIFEQALHKVGLKAKIEFVTSPNAQRSQYMVQTGQVLLSMKLFTDDSTPKGILKSSALIGYKDRIRGIHGLKSNHALMNVKTLEDLKNFSAVTTITRESDFKLLQKIGPSNLQLVNKREFIFTRIAYRNVDFTIFAIEKEFEVKHEAITLAAVPGLLIQTNSSMHFLISKKHLHGQMVFQALEKGLAKMQEQGLIKMYYQHVPQTEPDSKHWKIVNIGYTDLE